MEREPVRLVQESVRISLWAVLAGWLAKRLWRLLVLVLRSPTILVMLGLLVGSVVVGNSLGPAPLVTAAFVLITFLVV